MQALLVIPNFRGIVRSTIIAFEPKDMKRHATLLRTVIALNVHLFVSVLLGHRSHRNLLVEILNQQLLELVVQNGFLAERADMLAALQKLGHTVTVKRMAAA